MPFDLNLQTESAWNFVRQCPAYSPTPIREFVDANDITYLVKDESSRFTLGAFKALGGIYAAAMFLKTRWEKENHSRLEPEQMFDTEFLNWSGRFTLVCASAGNHGVAVAKAAQLFNARCRVHLAASVPMSFEEKLTAMGAKVIRSGNTYEDSMREAQQEGDDGDPNCVLLADSSWPGYLQIPTWIMEGYTVLAEEMRQHFAANHQWPGKVFLQAGVGGFAAAVAWHIRKHWEEQPQIIVVEPDAAPCLKVSHDNGSMTVVEGPTSNMGRLDCKEPSLLAFHSLQQTADQFITISDKAAQEAVEFLNDNGIATTPSGAAGLAGAMAVCQSDSTIGTNNICAAIVTEGSVQQKTPINRFRKNYYPRLAT